MHFQPGERILTHRSIIQMPRMSEVLLSRFCPQRFSNQRTTALNVAQPGSGNRKELPPKTWWWVELWHEKRQLFKEGVTYTAIFGVLFGMLVFSHWLIVQSPLEFARVLVLEHFHFWNFIVLIIIFALRSSIRAVLLELGLLK